MKHIFLFSSFILVSVLSFSQSTWVQKLNDYYLPDNQYIHTGDVVTGVKDMALGADGSIFILAKINQGSDQKIYKILPDSGTIVWEIGVGHFGFLSGSYCVGIKPTADSGFILLHNYWSQSTCTYTHGELEKYDGNGNFQWSGNYTNYPCFTFICHDAVQRSSGGYWIMMDGITYKLDINGNMTDSIYVYGKKIYEFPNGDLLVHSNSVIRYDTLGNIIWTTAASINDAVAFSPALPYFFLTFGSAVKKISSITGSVLWTKNYASGSLSTIAMTSDGGFEAGIGITPSDFFFSNGSYTPSYLVRADSTGDTLWTRTYTFPEYGISSIACLSNGSTIIGSGFLVGRADYQFFDSDYRAFCAALDSNGHGDLENTGYVWPGDANNNQLLNFVDDALFIMLANGNTGPPRIVPNQVFNCCENFGLSSDFGVDWSTTFGNGVNHKNADFDGNGLVDTNDVNRLGALWYFSFPDSITIQAPFRKTNPSIKYSTIPDFTLVAEHDTILPDSNLIFFIIAGSQSNPVDSIYGLAFSFSSTSQDISIIDITMYNCDLGSHASNLFSTSYVNNFGLRSFAMSCRYDHQNAINLYDTLGRVTVQASSLISTATPIELHIDAFNAIRWDETIIPFNLVNGTAVIDPAYNPISITKYPFEFVKLFPNPVHDVLKITTGNSFLKNFVVLNSTGQIINAGTSEEKTISISTRELPSGVYSVSIANDDSIQHYKFVVAR